MSFDNSRQSEQLTSASQKQNQYSDYYSSLGPKQKMASNNRQISKRAANISTVQQYLQAQIALITDSSKEQLYNIEVCKEMQEEVHNSVVDYIIRTDDHLKLDRQIDKEQIRLEKEKYAKQQIKNQLKTIISQANKAVNAKILEGFEKNNRNNDLLLSYQDLHQANSQKEQISKIYSSVDLRKKQHEGDQWLGTMQKQKEQRSEYLNSVKTKEEERFKKKQDDSQLRDQQLAEQLKEQRKKYLEVKAQERLERQQLRERNHQSHSPIVNQNGTQSYLYKQLEDKYINTIVASEKEKERQILEERKKHVYDSSISVKDFKVHEKEYLSYLINKQEENKQKLKQEVQKQRNIQEWLNRSIKKTSIHKKVESEYDASKYSKEIEKLKHTKLKNQKEAYTKMIDELYRPKVNESLHDEVQSRKEHLLNPEGKIRKLQALHTPYKDYLKEYKNRRISSSHIDLSYGKTNITPRKLNKSEDVKGPKTPDSFHEKHSKSPTEPNAKRLKKTIAEYKSFSIEKSEISSKQKSVDYLAHLRMQRNSCSVNDGSLSEVPDRRYLQLRKDISRAIQNNQRNQLEHASMQIQLLESQAKRKETLLKNQSFDYTTNAKKNEEIDKMYLQAIDTKLSILNRL